MRMRVPSIETMARRKAPKGRTRSSVPSLPCGSSRQSAARTARGCAWPAPEQAAGELWADDVLEAEQARAVGVGGCSRTVGVGPCWRSAPAWRIAMRSASAAASWRSWVTSSAAVPGGEDVAQLGEQLGARRGVEGAERLVEQQQPRREGERAGEADALRLAAGEACAAAPVGELAEAEPLQPLAPRARGARPRGTPREAQAGLDVARARCRARSSGRCRTAALRARTLRRRWPAGRRRRTSPAVGARRPPATRSSVDLPAPLAPSTASVSPAAMRELARARGSRARRPSTRDAAQLEQRAPVTRGRAAAPPSARGSRRRRSAAG